MLKNICAVSLFCIGLVGCGDGNSLVQPELNQVSEATMQQRNRTEIESEDNYKETCLFLNESFEKNNFCSLSVQTNLSIDGVQVVDQMARFVLLPDPATLDSFDVNQGTDMGDTLEDSQYEEGDVFYFYKQNSDVSFELVFEIVKTGTDSITVKYKVVEFDFLD